LNGKHIRNAISADEEKGEVLIYVMDGKNYIVASNGKELETTTIGGSVVIGLHHEAPEWARVMFENLKMAIDIQ
jgi:hypothetical protein